MSDNSTTSARHIVVGVDRSANAARAAAWAAGEAADRGLPLHLVHALDLPDAAGRVMEPPHYARTQREEAEDLLHRTAAETRKLRPALTVTTEVSDLGAPETLVDLSDDAAFLVTGTRGHGGFAGMLLGSVSLKLAAHAHSPVVVVRGEAPADPVQEIVLGVEPDEPEPAIRFAFESAAGLGARVRAVRAWRPPAGLRGADALTDREHTETGQVDDLLGPIRQEHPGVTVTTAVVRGNAVPVLIEAARGARMLVVGAHRHRTPLSVGAGYVVDGLLAHSPTPVAVVPTG
ncbi:universal stress protein [Streptacidiphilus carbonis]|uniref:universal stress protein n=1 Tax=Streptacidiphilus carbonis TaxID=105422 RepID=UPI0005A75CDE|nr:universal stress protein [Streptacidiphilus carbonis]